jgi:hypothetical protein
MRSKQARAATLFALLVSILPAAAALAQPFDGYLTSSPGFPGTHGFVQIPHSPALNPTGEITFEAWIFLPTEGNFGDCRSIAGKAWQQAWWVGVCTNVDGWILRSYVRGTSSLFDAGRVRTGLWHHIAVTDNGVTRRHYVDGELRGNKASFGPLGTSTEPMRIWSDAQYFYTPRGSIDEVRLWNIERNETQIRANLNVRIITAQPSLIGVWPLNGNGNDVIGPHDGVVMGTGVGFLISAVKANCGDSTATTLCLAERFEATARYRTGPPGFDDFAAKTVPCDFAGCSNSGLFWFFQDLNWEIMLKALDACGLNNRWWLFSAATTNVHYRLQVTDVTKGETKIYFNYPGPPAPAVTDTSAFATCP